MKTNQTHPNFGDDPDSVVYGYAEEYERALARGDCDLINVKRRLLFNKLENFERYLCVNPDPLGNPKKHRQLRQVIRRASIQAANRFRSGKTATAIEKEITRNTVESNEHLPNGIAEWVVQEVAFVQEEA